MAIMPHQIKELVESLRAELVSLQDAIRQGTSSVGEQQIAQNQEQKKHWQQMERIVAAQQIPPAERQNAETNQEIRHKQNLGVQKALVVVTALAFLAAAYYALEAHRQLSKLQDSLTISQMQLAESRNQLDTSASQFDRTMSQIINQNNIQLRAAKSSEKSAEAARKAADVARETLLISEGAEVVTQPPVMDAQNANVKIPLLNIGHIPSGKIYAIYHEATINIPSPSAPKMKIHPVESHWKHFDVDTLAPQSGGSTYSINVPLPGLDPNKYNAGLQQVVIVGSASYNIGFPDTPGQQWRFCYHSVFNVRSKEKEWLPCDWSTSITEVMSTDHYPDDEYQ